MQRLLLGLSVWVAFIVGPTVFAQQATDVVVYGGTSGGVIAAVQAGRMGKSVVLIEPSKHLGGMTTGGLGATDTGNQKAIGGVSREFYQRILKYYSDKSAWKYETQEQYAKREKYYHDDALFGFEPHVAEKIYGDMLAEAHVNIVLGERLDLKNGVKKDGPRIVSIRMESGREFPAKMFIDASYEGDLMAKAGVSYTVGREANSQYGERANGIEVRLAKSHQFTFPVDPYNKPGNATSGLVPLIHAGSPGEDGQADNREQAYNYRLCLTEVPENRVPFAKPEGYDPKEYELLLRFYEAGLKNIPWGPRGMPNKKTDTNNSGAFSTDFIGGADAYPDADYATREKITRDHI
ncbi:MAG TPA: FAD-dependent oxidoreductase, partial [Tepidisphaeraceae bacterium]|nr:FAD-dependent oxidoreductase [Tepidisphaeraceae bacterium]